MRQVFRTSLIAAALMVFALGAAEAGGKGKGAGMGRGDRMDCGNRGDRGDRVERMVRHLDLTPAQSAAMEKLRDEVREQIAPLMEQDRKLRAQMRDEWRKDVPDENRLVKLHRQMIRLEEKIGELRIEHRVDVRSLLTPAQRAELRSFEGDRSGRGKRRGGGWRAPAGNRR